MRVAHHLLLVGQWRRHAHNERSHASGPEIAALFLEPRAELSLIQTAAVRLSCHTAKSDPTVNVQGPRPHTAGDVFTRGGRRPADQVRRCFAPAKFKASEE